MRRSTTMPIATTMNANSVPMFTSAASVSRSTKNASAATTMPVAIVVRYGVLKRCDTAEKTGGSRWSRLIAKNTRLWPIMRMSVTVVRPASAPIEMICAIADWPTERNASASGASSSILS